MHRVTKLVAGRNTRALLVCALVVALTLCLGLGVEYAFAGPGTVVDDGFESGSNGANLASPPWYLIGSPANREYTSARAQVGSKSAYIKGATSGITGVYETASAGMSSNTAEVRFWLYAENTTQARFVDDYDANTANRAFHIQLDASGKIMV